MPTVRELLDGYDSCAVLLPGMYRGQNATLVECAYVGTEDGRPQYAYRLAEVTEGGPVTIFEGTDLYGPLMGVWPECEEMALTVLDFLCLDPDEVGDGYGEDWTEAQREWNHGQGENLGLICYDYQALQCSNAGPNPLNGEEALVAITDAYGFVWLRTGYDFDAMRAEFADHIAECEAAMS